MELENKYYTPDVSEFHVGFEFEALQDERFPKDDSSWEKLLIEDYINKNYTVYSMERAIKGWYDGQEQRVKYLDKEDIESLGFILKYPDGNLYTKGLYNLYFEKDNRICILQTKDRPHTLFDGTIKNKSELKILLNQLGIPIAIATN